MFLYESIATNIKIYPVPTHDNFKVLGVESNSILKLYNLQGVLLISLNLLVETNFISTNGLISGSYLIIITNENSVVTKKLVVR